MERREEGREDKKKIEKERKEKEGVEDVGSMNSIQERRGEE